MEIVFSNDPYQMNWVRPDFPYADVRLPENIGPTEDPLRASVTTEREGDLVHTEVVIRNTGDSPYFVRGGDVGITLPLEDRYDRGFEQVTQRCTAHLFCGGSSSFIVARRMGGESPHLGLVLTQGSLNSYSIVRDTQYSSNDRGCFVLHPSPFALDAGDEIRIAWTIFPFVDLEDFFAQAGKATRFLKVAWDRYVLFPGETATLTVQPSFDCTGVRVNGEELTPNSDGTYTLPFVAEAPGEYMFRAEADGRDATSRILVKAPYEDLLENRCRFIAANQQYDGSIAQLRGAFLTYDTDDRKVFYSQTNDVNAGRERVGMGILLTTYLTALREGIVVARQPDTAELVRKALTAYVAFVLRELVDELDGTVFNDCGRDNNFKRLYNAPWFATLFVTLYSWDGDPKNLLIAVRILRHYYDEGGSKFYPLEIPIVALCAALDESNMAAELDEMRSLFREHATNLGVAGTNYPPHEVNYEQSIVAPAVEVLLQTAIITGEDWFIEAAQPHIRALKQFQGFQPDYHLHEVAVRHWDGFWFGKRTQFGDTFPHHWSALSGNVFAQLYQITGDEKYLKRANASFRGVLPMIFDDGRASCAFVFPRSINGRRSVGYDPYANDQDWGLYFSLRQVMARPGAEILS